MFNEFLVDMFSSLLELEVVYIDSVNKLYDFILCVFLSKCKNLREFVFYECICIINVGFELLFDKLGIIFFYLIFVGINDDGMECICRLCFDFCEVLFVGCMYVIDILIVYLCIDCLNLEFFIVLDLDIVYYRLNIMDGGLVILF